ncbi:MAG: cyclic nucleotide-binding domain-containing protein [Candidatus Omnitrophica bacterium]|nr:cyclic nucleotide-binding domain-containing protein [Candidatus Omnitrophota bacterium]
MSLIALFVGFLSAVSLPIGSAIGLAAKPNAKITSAFMAFGGGALLFALTIEIVAHSFHLVGFMPLALGCLLGGILYELLNHGLNSMGAFFRKGATVIRQLTRMKLKKAEKILQRLAEVPVLQALPARNIAKLATLVEERVFEENELIFKENSPAEALYIIDQGQVEIFKEGKSIARGTSGDTFGEMALLTNAPRTARAIATKKSTLFLISKNDFNALLKASPELKKSFENLLIKRGDELGKRSVVPKELARQWKEEAVSSLKSQDLTPTSLEIENAAKAGGQAGIGIWLGILLDGIPESLVIGIATKETVIPWALIAGVFLANLPEAMSSSVIMKNQKYTGLKILLMWSSITLMTALGAFIGNIFLQNLHLNGIAILEGMAAGAMLVMIAETMLPEAFEQGGAVVGLSTLAGFLTALFVKSIS